MAASTGSMWLSAGQGRRVTGCCWCCSDGAVGCSVALSGKYQEILDRSDRAEYSRSKAYTCCCRAWQHELARSERTANMCSFSQRYPPPLASGSGPEPHTHTHVTWFCCFSLVDLSVLCSDKDRAELTACFPKSLETCFWTHAFFTTTPTLLECWQHHAYTARNHLVVEKLKRTSLELPLFACSTQ